MLKTLRSRDLMETLEGIKVKPSTMLAALGGILILAYVVVGASYFNERSQQSGLKQQVEAGGGTLSSVGDPRQTLKDLQDRLTDLQGSLVALQTAFPTKLDSTAIVQGLVDYANQSHVSIKQMNGLPATEVKSQKEGDPGYTVLRYTLIVEGGQPEMLSFLSLLEKGTSQTAALGDVTVANAEGANQMTLSVSFYAGPQSASGAGGTTPTPVPKTVPSTANSKPN
jgi:hypothetical protein